MSRTLTGTLRSTIDADASYQIKAYIEVAPSRIFFDTITDDNAVSGADAQGVVRDPVKQAIGYNTDAEALSTFYSDTVLKYSNQGSSTLVSTAYTSNCKPGISGDDIYIYNGTTVARYTIDWALVSAENADPLSADGASVTPATAVVACYGLSATEAGLITNNDGGFSCIYMTDSTQNVSTSRFMFPKRVDWDGSSRTMLEMGIFSAALKLGNKIFFYISNASYGSVEGMYYDTDTGIWSDVFTVIPTDLEVSLCELMLTSGYTRNGTAYLCGQFSRTDFYEGAEPYTLLMQSEDGMTFSIDRFSMVSDLGYRFLAMVGADDNLYLGSCNRVCYAPVTWVFDGLTGSAFTKEILSGDHIKNLSDRDLSQLNLEPIAGNEDYFDSTNLVKDARLRLYVGYITGMDEEVPPAPIEEYILYGTYIVEQIAYDLATGRRASGLTATNEATFKLTGLSMPFYAEIFGKSCTYDPMTATSGKLYTAPGGSRTETKFQIDFWKHETYSNTGAGITGISMMDGGGVSHYSDEYPHKLGIIVSEELKDLLDLTDNPIIKATSVTFKLYGWSHPYASGGVSDIFEIVLETEDEDGAITTTISNEGKKFPTTWPSTVSGTLPIEVTFTGLTIGHKIRRIGVVIWNSVSGSVFNLARVEVASDVEVPIRFEEPNTPWTVGTDGTFSVPSGGRPFVMFSQKPYNAYNFSLMAFFENSVTSWTTGYPVAAGLVGHAYDGANFILGRYNRTNSKCEIVKVRNGIETTLVSTTAPFTVPTGAGTSHGIMFTHKDGKYTLSIYRPSSTQFEQVTSYSWTAADDFQYTDRIATMKCGIYGQIGSPLIKLLAYTPSGDDNISNSDGIPIDPMYVPTTLPISGTILVGDKEFTYTGRVAHPTVCRGPYQFRQASVYSAPYGNGSAGLECRDFDWTAVTTLLDNYLISLDSGASFKANGALWQTWNKTGGVVQYYYNRARYYSSNAQIANVYHTLSNKVWVTGYLTGISQISGAKTKIQAGSFAQIKRAGSIKCFWYAGTGGSDDTTIADLIRKICQLSGAKATFSGNYTNASLSVSGVTNVYEDYYAEGFDFSYETAAATTHTIKTNIKVTSTNYEDGASFESDTGLDLVITHAGSGVFQFKVVSTPSNTQLFAYQNTQSTGAQKFRVLFFENNMSVYQNGRWIFSFAFDELQYDQSNLIDIDMDGTLTVTNIEIKELGDWREAVYIDLETDGKSAIGSVIQERPVEIHARPDGGLDFTYLPDRDVVEGVVAPRQHKYSDLQPGDGASDAIVYGSKDVKTLQYNNYAKELGFSTKLMRLPNLNVGAIEAARMMLLKSYEGRKRHSLTIRPDLAITPNDIYHVDYTASGTSRAMDYYMIVESVGLSLQMTGRSLSATMDIKARETTL